MFSLEGFPLNTSRKKTGNGPGKTQLHMELWDPLDDGLRDVVLVTACNFHSPKSVELFGGPYDFFRWKFRGPPFLPFL